MLRNVEHVRFIDKYRIICAMVSMWLNCSYQAMIINPFDPFNAIHMSIVRIDYIRCFDHHRYHNVIIAWMQVLLLPFGLAVLRIAEAYKSYVKRPYGSSITQAADVRLGLTMATWNILLVV